MAPIAAAQPRNCHSNTGAGSRWSTARPQLSFGDGTRARRDEAEFLTLTWAIALLHHHQRLRKRVTRYGVEVLYVARSPSRSPALGHRPALSMRDDARERRPLGSTRSSMVDGPGFARQDQSAI